jgi:hypothetical protein
VLHPKLRTCCFLALALLSFGPVTTLAAPPWAALPRERAERIVFLAGELSEESLIALTANLAASEHPGVVLLHSPKVSAHVKAFLAAFQPEQVVPIGRFPDGTNDLKKRLGVTLAPVAKWKHNLPTELGRALFPCAERLVVCPSEPRSLLLQAACLAGALRAPLFIARGDATDAPELRRWAGAWHPAEVYVVGAARAHLHDVRLVRLADEKAVAASCARHLLARGPVRALVVANPSDARKGMAPMSCLAPWVALRHGAPLLLTNDAGDNTPAVVAAALKDHPRLHTADSLLLMADLRAIPMERRPNPVAGKDSHIEMEPLTPAGTEPFSFATGRLFHPEPGVIALMLARQRLLDAQRARRGKRKALVVSNPGSSLPLLEMFSRSTARELRNGGYQTTALFGDEVRRDDMRRLLPENDIFLWEGHHSTLIKDYGFAAWTEALPPSLVFLQSCLALAEPKAQPLLERGAVGIVGTSTRTYSASGGAFALAYFDALLYDGCSLGGSLRQAKNFLLAYSLLKEKRLGKEARLGGANLRSAWAFTLWGDPTVRLPRPETADALAAVRHEVHGHTITVTLPETAYDPVKIDRFRAEMRPNARLAGLLRAKQEDGSHLVPFVFAEVALPKGPPNRTPRLHSRVPESHWVFCWDERRRCGYLLVTPRPRDQKELRFHIDWEVPTAEVRGE